MVANNSGFSGIRSHLSFMRNRFLSSGVLLFVLLTGAWGNVLAASLCPRMAQDHSCCHAKAMQHAHEAMGDMQMNEMQMSEMQMPSAAEQETQSMRAVPPDAECEHCLSHSQLTTKLPTLREAEQTRRGEDVAAPLALASHASSIPLFVLPVHARPHAPPGAMTSRHVLINVFRI